MLLERCDILARIQQLRAVEEEQKKSQQVLFTNLLIPGQPLVKVKDT